MLHLLPINRNRGARNLISGVRGQVHQQRGEHKAALSLLEEAATELPNVALIRYHLGVTYASTGDNAKAAEQLKKALELGANDNQLGEKVKAALKKMGS